MRFAFYGRVSTEDNQDPQASDHWQFTRARGLAEPAGHTIVADYFDIGTSRSLPWKRRPRANDLLATLKDPRRGFEGVVIGEPQRAFYGNRTPVHPVGPAGEHTVAGHRPLPQLVTPGAATVSTTRNCWRNAALVWPSRRRPSAQRT